MEKETVNSLHTLVTSIQILIILIVFTSITYFFFVKYVFIGLVYSAILIITSFFLAYLIYFVLWFSLIGWKWWIKLAYKGIKSEDGFIETISRYKILKGF